MDGARHVAYKFQANADIKRTQRTKAVEVKRKQQRSNVMMSNRRLPLDELKETNVLAEKGNYKSIYLIIVWFII